MSEEKNLTYRDKVDVKLLFMQQVTRCLMNASNEEFGPHVEALLNLLPTPSYLALMNKSDEWSEEKEEFKFKYDFGRERGNPKNPLLYNKHQPVERLEDGSIDWDDPNIMSPTKNTYLDIYHDRLFRMIITEAQEVGILWTDESGGLVNLPGNIMQILNVSKDTPRTPT